MRHHETEAQSWVNEYSRLLQRMEDTIKKVHRREMELKMMRLGSVRRPE